MNYGYLVTSLINALQELRKDIFKHNSNPIHTFKINSNSTVSLDIHSIVKFSHLSRTCLLHLYLTGY